MTKDSVPSGFHLTKNGRIVRDDLPSDLVRANKEKAKSVSIFRRRFNSKTQQEEKIYVRPGFHLTKNGNFIRDELSTALSKAEKERIRSEYNSLLKAQPEVINESSNKSSKSSQLKGTRSTIHSFSGAGRRNNKLYRIRNTSQNLTLRKNAKFSRSIPNHVKIKVSSRDKGQCVRCGSKQFLEFDHRKPYSKGGASTHDNIQLLCRSCNRRKSNK